MQYALTTVIRISVLLSLCLVLCGGLLYLYHHGHETMHYATFSDTYLKKMPILDVFARVQLLSAQGLIQLGILTLILSQMVRVGVVAWFFAQMKDYRFTSISLFVLLVMVGVYLL